MIVTPEEVNESKDSEIPINHSQGNIFKGAMSSRRPNTLKDLLKRYMPKDEA